MGKLKLVGKREEVEEPEEIVWPSMSGKTPHRSSVPNVLHWLQRRGIVAQFNEFSQRATITIDRQTTEFTDREILRIVNEIHTAGCIISEGAVVSGVKHLAYCNSYHPVRDYLDGLSWDGKKRLDKLLPKYLGAIDTKLNRAIGKAWMTAAVRRVRQPGCKFDSILVLQGKQGVGKSTFFRVLASDEYYNDTIDIGASSKEVIESLSGAWVIEFSELSAMAHRDVERVKQFITTQTDRARTAFERTAKSVPRGFVFGASTNATAYLRDETGNRRFWTVPVRQLEEGALIRDRDQLWAEAAYLEARGEPINIPPELWPEVAEANEAFAVEDPIADLTFDVLNQLPDHAIVRSADLACAVGLLDVSKRGGKNGSSIAVGARRAGWVDSKRAIAGLLKNGTRHYRKEEPDEAARLYSWHIDARLWRAQKVELPL